MNVFGCATQSVLTETERAAVMAGEKALVLLRILYTVDDKQQEPFIAMSLAADPVFTLGLGSFATMGEPGFAAHGFLSEASRRAGWTYLVLSPGIYYIAVLGPDSSAISQGNVQLQEAPRWRIDIPENVPLVYVGTLPRVGKTAGELLFGGKIIRPANSDELVIRNEQELARGLLAEHFPGVGEMKTIPMQRWQRGDPVIIRSPARRTTR